MTDLILGAIIGAGAGVLGTLVGLVPTFLAHGREKARMTQKKHVGTVNHSYNAGSMLFLAFMSCLQRVGLPS